MPTTSSVAFANLGVASQRLHVQADARVANAMTVDVEDFFHVSAFEKHVRREHWSTFDSRVSRNTHRLLEMFAESGTTATFFVLGWVAERFPHLVRQIAEAGHEIGSHGYSHRLVYEMTPAEFAEDLRRATGAIQAACSVPVLGYRAPSFSITRDSLWALDVLVSHGFAYDASIFPIRHDRYGIPEADRHPHVLRCADGTIWEFPGSTVRVAGQNMATAGGGYFRLLPYAWTRRGIHHLNTIERQPAIFYLHPWEIDPEQPRIRASRLSSFRHYRNLDKTESRLKRLLSEFRFDTALSVLSATVSGSRTAAEASGAFLGLFPQGARN